MTAASIGGSALDVLAQLAMAMPGMDTLASVGDTLVLAGDAAAWMAANWGIRHLGDRLGQRCASTSARSPARWSSR